MHLQINKHLLFLLMTIACTDHWSFLISKMISVLFPHTVYPLLNLPRGHSKKTKKLKWPHKVTFSRVGNLGRIWSSFHSLQGWKALHAHDRNRFIEANQWSMQRLSQNLYAVHVENIIRVCGGGHSETE